VSLRASEQIRRGIIMRKVDKQAWPVVAWGGTGARGGELTNVL
jgi:hypothetical protein